MSLCFISLLYHVGRLWVCQKDPSAALGMTKRGADGFSLVFRSLPSIRFLRCVTLQRVRSGEECPKDCGERSSRIVAEYKRKGGTLAAGGFLVTSFRAKSRNLPCPAVIHVSVKIKIDVFVFRFPAVSRRPFMGLPERSLGCARDDETGSGWFLTRFQIAAIHPLPSACHSSTSSQRGGMPDVISSEVEKSSLPCGYPYQCENENRRLCVSFPCCITSAVMGLPERSLGCARDDETGSGWFLTRFQIAAIHPLPSACPFSTSSQRGGMPEGLRRAFFSYRQPSSSG